jgi:hypothetical protein
VQLLVIVQILLQFKGPGLVQSTRGATGGYALAKPPEAISLAVLEGPTQVQSNIAVQTTATRALQSVWPAKSPTLRRRKTLFDLELDFCNSWRTPYTLFFRPRF